MINRCLPIFIALFISLFSNVAKNSHGGSVIDVSEQFIMKRQNGTENSRYNSSIIMQVEDKRGTATSVHEMRTPFNDESF
jgi:hypothetical protein